MRAVPRSSAPVASVRARLDAQALSDRRIESVAEARRARRLAPAARRDACSEGGVNFAVFSPRATRDVAAALSRRRPTRAARRDRARRRGAPHVRLLARVRRRRARGLVLHLARRRPRRARGRLALRRAARAARSVGAARQRRGLGSRRLRSTATPTPRCAPRSRAADDYDWEGDEPLRRPLQDAVIYELHVGGLHAPSVGRRRRARHVSRPRRKDSVPASRSASPTSSCCPCSRSTRRTCRRRPPRSACAISGATAP